MKAASIMPPQALKQQRTQDNINSSIFISGIKPWDSVNTETMCAKLGVLFQITDLVEEL